MLQRFGKFHILFHFIIHIFADLHCYFCLCTGMNLVAAIGPRRTTRYSKRMHRTISKLFDSIFIIIIKYINDFLLWDPHIEINSL